MKGRCGGLCIRLEGRESLVLAGVDTEHHSLLTVAGLSAIEPTGLVLRFPIQSQFCLLSGKEVTKLLTLVTLTTKVPLTISPGATACVLHQDASN
jgi:hypothetical protein